MKKILLLALTGLSFSSFAQICQVDMVDRYHRVIRQFTAYGDESCFEGMKECRKTIRMDVRYSDADCVRTGMRNPPPVPTPVPVPTPRPVPVSDNKRMVNPGESVFYFNKIQTVVGMSMNGLYTLKDSYGFMTNGVSRVDISVTAGCSLDLCVNDSVFSLSSNKFVKVAALTYMDQFITRDDYGFYSMTTDRYSLAVPKGCMMIGNGQICVNNTVVDSFNNYKTVVALQQNGKVVLRDNFGFYTTNVDPMNLVIVR